MINIFSNLGNSFFIGKSSGFTLFEHNRTIILITAKSCAISFPANNKHTTDLEKAKQELESRISELESQLENLDIPSLEGYATEQWVLDKHYLTEHQDLSDYATKEDLEKIDVTDQLKDYAKTKDVESKISKAKSELEGKIPSLNGYATEK